MLAYRGRPARALLISLVLAPSAAGGVSAGSLTDTIAARFTGGGLNATALQQDPHADAVLEFYKARGFRPVWVSEAGANVKAKEIASLLLDSYKEGLDREDYRAEEIADLLAAPDAAHEADLELALSRAVIDFGRDAQAGRVVPSSLEGHFIKPAADHPLEILTGAAEAASPAAYLDGLLPQSPQYRRLRAAYVAYAKRAAAGGGWRRLADRPSLKPGMQGPAVRALRLRLIEGGDLTGSDNQVSEVFDPALEEAVKRFQARHGLDTDGIVGPRTRGELNVPIEDRVRQMALNLERRRWMPDDLGQTYIFVNLANFELKLVDGPKTLHTARVVVGTPYNRTPVFSGLLSYLVFHPQWHVPPNIARDEMLPEIQKDPRYLADRDITVLSGWGADAKVIDPATIDWRAITRKTFHFKLVQEPGPGNALGRIKFVFPNQHNIYLHDTPSKALFDRNVRSFSHGCIRVQHPVALAKLLLRNDPDWPPDAIDAALAGSERRVVTLKHKIPIHITYLTAWVNKDGTVNFRDDIYGRDKALATALAARRPAE